MYVLRKISEVTQDFFKCSVQSNSHVFVLDVCFMITTIDFFFLFFVKFLGVYFLFTFYNFPESNNCLGLRLGKFFTRLRHTSS